MKNNLIIISLTLLVLAIIAFTAIEMHLKSELAVISQFNEHQLLLIQTTAASVEEVLAARTQGLKVLSSFKSVQNFDLPVVESNFKEMLSNIKSKGVESISLYDNNGIIVAATNSKVIGRVYKESPGFQWAQKPENKNKTHLAGPIHPYDIPPDTSGKKIFSEGSFGSVNNQPYRFQLIVPVYREVQDKGTSAVSMTSEGSFGGVTSKFLGMVTYTLSLTELITHDPGTQSILTKYELWIVDTSGTLLYQSKHPEMITRNIKERPEECRACHETFDYVDDMLKQRKGTLFYQLNDQPKKLSAYARMEYANVSWVIVLNIPRDRITSLVSRNLSETLILLGIVAIALVIGSTLLYRNYRLKVRAEEEAKQRREKRRLEEKIQKSEQRYKTVIENIFNFLQEGILVFTDKLNLFNKNKTFDDIVQTYASKLEYTEDELREIIIQEAKKRLVRMGPFGTGETSTTIKIEKKEEQLILEFDFERMVFAEEESNYVVSLKDITERKRAEEALRESEERFTTFMNNSPVVAWLKDPATWTFSYINNAFEEVFDITREAISKKTDFDLWPEEVARQLRENDLKVMSSDKTIQTFENVPLRDGTIHHWLVFKFPLRTPSGKLFLAGTAVDITKHKRAEEEIHKRNRELSILYKIERLASQSLNIEEILEDSINAVLQTLKIEACGIYLIEPDNETLSLNLYKGFSDEFVNNIRHIKLGEGISGKSAAEKKPIVMDISEYSKEHLSRRMQELSPFVIEEGFQTLASTPLLSAGELVGALTMGTHRSHAFPPEEMDLLSSIGIQLGSAVRNAQLYQNVQAELERRKCAEKEIVQQKENFQQLFESSPDAIAMLDTADRVITVNKGFEKLFQYSLNEIKNKSLNDVIIPKDRIQESIDLLNRVAGGKTFHVETKRQRKDGSLVDVSIVGYPIIIDSLYVGLYAIYTDITERKLSENLIRKSEMQFRLVWENSADGMRLTDEHGVVIAVNKAFCRMVGKNKEEIEEKPLSIIYEKEQQAHIQKNYHESFISRAVSPHLIREVILWDGKKIWFEVSNSFFEFEGQIPLQLSIFRNISESKLLEKELINSKEQLRALTSRLQNIREGERLELSRELHDNVGQILTALQMDISFLEKNIINRNRKINPQIIKKKFSGITELLNSTIDIIREISTNLRPAILDSFGLISTIEWYLKEFQKKSGIVCNFISEVKKIKLNPHISIMAYRILQEALTNIIRHSQATLVEVRFKKSQSKIILEIKDNGIGISNDALYNVNSLGLSGMRERALSINGDVIFSALPLNDPLVTDEIPGKGTIVVLSIPIKVSKND
jgi:PAS domain S-box-containing protein